MARIARVVVPGYPHHVVQRGVRSMQVFRDAADREIYLDYMCTQGKRHGLEFLAWCLMTNHVHLIVVPRTESSLARGIGEAHRLYTRHVNASEDVRGYLFQGRFASSVMDERHLLAAARYIELNPVRARIVERPADYEWSSARAHLDASAPDPLVKDRTLLGLVDDWQGFLAGEDAAAERVLRDRTRTGRPAGDLRFLKRLERLTGRLLRPRKAGRKRKA